MDTGQNISLISSALVERFSDERITRDLNDQLFSGLTSCESVTVELDGLGRIEIPPNSRHKVCSVTLHRDLVPKSIEVKVICAVGGVERESNGIIDPKYCFVR